MTCGLVHASYSLPELQAVKLTFFAPWVRPIVFRPYPKELKCETILLPKRLFLLSYLSKEKTVSFAARFREFVTQKR